VTPSDARRLALAIVAVITPLYLAAPTANAQTTTLSITSGSTATFANPTMADYVTGYIDGPTVNFTVTLAGGNNNSRTTTVEVCATNASLGSGKALSNLLWQPADLSKGWQPITTGCTGAINAARVVGAQVLNKGQSWSGGVKLRMVLNWNDTAASYGTPIELAVSVSTP